MKNLLTDLLGIGGYSAFCYGLYLKYGLDIALMLGGGGLFCLALMIAFVTKEF